MKKLGFIVEMKDCKDAADLRRWVDLAQQQGIDGVELLFNSKCASDATPLDQVIDQRRFLFTEATPVNDRHTNLQTYAAAMVKIQT